MVFNGSTAAPVTADARRPTAAAPASVRQVPVIRAQHAEPGLTDDQFLSEIELATAAPRTRELRAIYAFTLEEPRDAARPVGKD
jgi:hypothetical protein